MKNIIGKKHSQTGKRGNVMTALNWMCGTFEVVLLPTALSSVNSWLGVGAFSLASLIVIYYAVMYMYFALTDPNRLQTEEFNLESQQMLLSHSGADSVEIIDNNAKIISSDSKSKN